MTSADMVRKKIVTIFTLDSNVEKNPMNCLIVHEMQRQRREVSKSSGDPETIAKVMGVNPVVLHTRSLIDSLYWVKSVIPVALVDDTELRGYWSPVGPESSDRLGLPGWAGLAHWVIRVGRLSVKKGRDVERIARQIVFTTRSWADLDPSSRAPWNIRGPFSEGEAISPEIVEEILGEEKGEEERLPIEEMR